MVQVNVTVLAPFLRPDQDSCAHDPGSHPCVKGLYGFGYIY